MSISLNVVNIAFVFCASFKRDAIFRRIRFILTRCSDRVPLISREKSCGGTWEWRKAVVNGFTKNAINIRRSYLDGSRCGADSTNRCRRHWCSWSWWRRWRSAGWTRRYWNHSNRSWCWCSGSRWRRWWWSGCSWCLSLCGCRLGANCASLNFKQLLASLHGVTILHVNLFDYTSNWCRHSHGCFVGLDFHHILVQLHFIADFAGESVLKNTNINFYLISAKLQVIENLLDITFRHRIGKWRHIDYLQKCIGAVNERCWLLEPFRARHKPNRKIDKIIREFK